MKAIYGKEKGVSPVIATILMVAITVVLASAVYLMVSGYIGSAPSKPVAISVTPQTNATGTQFLITAGNLTIVGSTTLTITITGAGHTYTYVISVNNINTAASGVTNNTYGISPSGGTGPKIWLYSIYQYKTSATPTPTYYISAGDFIFIPLTVATPGNGATMTWTYNGNAVYHYTF
jgi:flagellin-like protein